MPRLDGKNFSRCLRAFHCKNILALYGGGEIVESASK